ncbi:MAG TPA: hypothetical protein VG943_02385 [Caulobacterales bacterium]|nr:hypothetical protein [Caulobacterales bacterium]
MDQATMLHYVVLAIGGVIGGNILGALTRGGGGVVGRTIIGAIGGAGAGYASEAVAQIGSITAMWSNLLPDSASNSARLGELITGAAGGGVLGLIGGLLLRPRG